MKPLYIFDGRCRSAWQDVTSSASTAARRWSSQRAGEDDNGGVEIVTHHIFNSLSATMTD